MIRIVILISLLVTQACAQDFGPMTFEGSFPSRLKEVSGLEVDKGRIWAIEDNGNKDKVYQLNRKGEVLEEFKINNAKNEDWEDLALDSNGTMFIGDFGNNNNARKSLTIYKIPKNEFDEDKPDAEKIEFSYPEQVDFPPKKEALFYDTEAFFAWNDSLYIFTKDRSRPYQGNTLIYKVPAEKGEYKAELLGSIVLCDDQDRCSVTAADISEDGKTIALLTYGLVFLITDFDFSNLSNHTLEMIDLKYYSQTESISFLDKDTLLIADERNKANGGNLYSLKIK